MDGATVDSVGPPAGSITVWLLQQYKLFLVPAHIDKHIN